MPENVSKHAAITIPISQQGVPYYAVLLSLSLKNLQASVLIMKVLSEA